MFKYISGYFNEFLSIWRIRWGFLLVLCKRNLRMVKCVYIYCIGFWLLFDFEFCNYGFDNLGIFLMYCLNLDYSVYERSLNYIEFIWFISYIF